MTICVRCDIHVHMFIYVDSSTPLFFLPPYSHRQLKKHSVFLGANTFDTIPQMLCMEDSPGVCPAIEDGSIWYNYETRCNNVPEDGL